MGEKEGVSGRTAWSAVTKAAGGSKSVVDVSNVLSPAMPQAQVRCQG